MNTHTLIRVMFLLITLSALAACGGQDTATPEVVTSPITATNAAQVIELSTLVCEDENPWVWSMTWSHDGAYIAAGVGKSVCLWDYATGELLVVLRAKNPYGISNVFRYNEMLFAFTGDGDYYHWDAEAGAWQLISEEDFGIYFPFTPETNYDEQITTGTTTPDMKLTAWGTDTGIIRLWDYETGVELLTLEGHSGRVENLVFSPDGSLLASTGEDDVIRLWDVATGAEKLMLQEKVREVNSMTVENLIFSPDGSLLASIDKDDVIRLWDITTDTEKLMLQEKVEKVNGIAFSTDGTLLIGGAEEYGMYLWDTATGAELAVLEIESTQEFIVARVTAVEFNPDGTLLAVGATDGTVRLFGLPPE